MNQPPEPPASLSEVQGLHVCDAMPATRNGFNTVLPPLERLSKWKTNKETPEMVVVRSRVQGQLQLYGHPGKTKQIQTKRI